MKTKFISKELSLVIIVFSLVIICMTAVTKKTFAQEPVTYVQTFDNYAEVSKDFSAYYIARDGGASVAEQINSPEGHFYVENGELVRKNDIEQAAGTNKMAVLTYGKEMFDNFEAEVDFTQGTQSYFWPAICFRQTEEGKSFFTDGAGVFIQREGIPTLWGSTLVGGPYQGAVISDYSKLVKHNLKIRLQGNQLDVYLDGEFVFEKILRSAFYQEGYISLISVNNNSVFDNFKVTKLEPKDLTTKPKPQPIPSADTPDSMDKLLEDKGTADLPLGRDVTSAVKSTGCLGSVTGAIALFSLFFVAMFIKRK